MDDERLTAARVARLATTDPDGRPHLVPIVFALEDGTLYSAVDRKPKRSTKLRRIENARARPDVTVLVDHYDEDWGRLWWIRLRGRARVLDEGEERERALALLGEKYPQYRTEPPDGPVLAVDVTDVRDWSCVSPARCFALPVTQVRQKWIDSVTQRTGVAPFGHEVRVHSRRGSGPSSQVRCRPAGSDPKRMPNRVESGTVL